MLWELGIGCDIQSFRVTEVDHVDTLPPLDLYAEHPIIKDLSVVCHIKIYALVISPLKLGQGLNQSVRVIFQRSFSVCYAILMI